MQGEIEPTTLNNEAVRLLRIGEYDDALLMLTAALEISKQHLNNQPNDHDKVADPHNSSSCKNTSQEQCNEAHQQQFEAEGGITLDYFMRPDFGNFMSENGCARTVAATKGCGYLYQCGILIPDFISSTSNNDNNAKALLSAITIFNLALAHHLNGLQKKSETMLTKANQLYELAHTLQMQEGDHSVFFTVAIVNNMALIHRLLRNKKTADKFFDHLLSILLFIVDSGIMNHTNNIGLEGFFRNVSHLIFPRRPAAPAA